MPHLPRVLRRPQSTLVIYEGPPAAIYKLNPRDSLRIEQDAQTSLDFLSQTALVTALNTLPASVLPLDADDEAALAQLGVTLPVAPPPVTPRPVAPVPAAPRPLPPSATSAQPRPDTTSTPTASPRPAQPVPGEEPPASGLRVGLIATVIGLGLVLLLILWALSRLFASPSGGSTATITPGSATSTAITSTVTLTPDVATAIALTNVSVRNGPGESYTVIGILPAGGSATIIGKTEDNAWWQIRADNIQGGAGWVASERIQARNTDAVPVVTPPPLPTPTPTPLTTFRGWKGEYFANPNLQAPAAVVQDDPDISFNWGAGEPVTGVPADNFSARWSRQVFFEEGNYRFRVAAQGGVRVWVDGRPIVNDWQNAAMRQLEADSGLLTRGDHSVVIEYVHFSGDAQLAASWQFQANQPPTAIITGPTQGMIGQPLTFDGRSSSVATGHKIVRYEWRFGDGTGDTQAQSAKTYSTAGTFDITLVVTDDAGLTGVAVQQVTILAPTATPTTVAPPVAIISGPSQTLAGAAVTFDGSSSTPVGGLNSYRWDFGDGGAANIPTASHVFAQPGLYVITLTVSNAGGQTSQARTTVQVTANTPTTTPLLGLQTTPWALQNAMPDARITANFSEGRITGSAGCNTYEGTYSTTGSSISFGPLSISNQTCAPAILDQENLFLARLQVANQYEISGNELRLSGSMGDESFRLTFVAVSR